MKFEKEYIDTLCDHVIEKTEAMQEGAWWSDESDDEDKENVRRFIHCEILNKDFNDNGLKNIPDFVELFRVVFLDNESNLNRDFLGFHWVRTELLLRKHILNIMRQYNMTSEKAFVLKATFSKEALNIIDTVYHNVAIDHEFEVTVKKGSQPIEFFLSELE